MHNFDDSGLLMAAMHGLPWLIGLALIGALVFYLLTPAAPTNEGRRTAMNTTHPDHPATAPKAVGLSRTLKTALLMVALIGGFYLLREHWDHVAGNWIYLLLLACPLMHMFHGHGGHGGHGDQTAPPDTRKE
jgi:hypothetical protein